MSSKELIYLGIGVLLGYLALPFVLSLFTRGKG